VRTLSDELLAKLVGRGNGHAFGVLYERHHQALYRYCRSILRDEHDAQDALQSTMTRAYAALRARERDVSLRAWLFRIAHNESITILRKHGRELELDQSGLQAQANDDPHSLLESRGRLRQLVCDLHELRCNRDPRSADGRRPLGWQRRQWRRCRGRWLELEPVAAGTCGWLTASQGRSGSGDRGSDRRWDSPPGENIHA
jgi:RNA polymerase sigma factor (sigma-70 family)